ncbi:MAG: M16 family metallopeptidase [Nitrospinota bacterium]
MFFILKFSSKSFGLLVALIVSITATICMSSPSYSSDLHLLSNRLHQFRLDNGLKVLIFKRDGIKQFSAHIVYNVGSVDEENGYSGLAHLLEHMMFKGTKTVGSLNWAAESSLYQSTKKLGLKLDQAISLKKDPKLIEQIKEELRLAERAQSKFFSSEIYSEIYSAAGGVGFNAGTSKDHTNYIVRLPSNRLELWAFIESQRFNEIVLRDFYRERDVVLEERKTRYENSQDGKLYESFLSLAYSAHPYFRPIIGWESDIKSLPLSKLEEFIDQWYRPNNCTIVITGNVDINQTEKIIRKYFSQLEAKELPSRNYSIEPPQAGYKKTTVRMAAANPALMLGFHKPSSPSRDDYIFDLIHELLSGSSSSRLVKRLKLDQEIASTIATFGAPASRYPNLFVVSAKPKGEHTLEELEDSILHELTALQVELISDDELVRAKKKIEVSFIMNLKSHYSMSRNLAFFELITGSASNLFRYVDEINSITKEEIQAAARQYFQRDQMSVAYIKRKDAKK